MAPSMVASSDKICFVPIVGRGGIGKTTLAQFVYNDEKVNKNFDLKAWVCVSENFDNLEILKAILERINGSASNLQCLDSLETRIREILKGNKFFVVLDDVWDNFLKVWDKNYCSPYIFTRFSLWFITFFLPLLVPILKNVSCFCP